jgi:hypothetical protein
MGNIREGRAAKTRSAFRSDTTDGVIHRWRLVYNAVREISPRSPLNSRF